MSGSFADFEKNNDKSLLKRRLVAASARYTKQYDKAKAKILKEMQKMI